MRTLAIVLSSFLFAASVVPATAQKKDEVLVLTDELHNASNQPAAAAKVWEWLRGEWGAPDPNRALDSDKNTFMHYAATINRLDILREAVRLGGDCNRRNAYGATPLHFAAAQGALGPGAQSLRVLMRCEAGPGVQRECARGDRTGKSCRADPNLQDGHGDTPLHTLYGGVVLRGAFPIKNLLGVSKSKLPHSRGWGGARADILKFLLQEAKADPDIKNKAGDTPLRLAIRRAKNLSLSHVSFLLRHGADPDTRNNKGVTPLFEALSESNDSSYFDYDMKYLIALLIKRGADPDLRDAKGDTPLIWAAKEAKHEDGLKQLMKALLAGGADPCLRDRSGKLPIDYTLNGSSREILLYKAGGSLDWATDICARDLLGARKREKKLNLTRKMKREIQACLEELKLAPVSTDGAFGPPTRKAIRAWQTREGKKGIDAAGYLAGGEPDALLAACKPAGPQPLCTGQTGSGCWMEYTNRRGCYTWNPNPQTEETVTWSGGCVDGRASGRGKRVWRSRQQGAWKSSSQEGEMRAGIEHGHWILRFASGKTWEGSYVDGKLQGLWVSHGAGEPAQQCRENGKKVDMSACLKKVEDRAMEVAGPAELRHGPGDAFSRKANLSSGEKVKVKAEAGEWALVETSGGIAGFVRKSVLKEVVFSPGHVFRDCPECPEMVVVPAGSFMMGSPAHQKGRGNDEGPRHRVTIVKPFAVGKYEVTFAEWDTCLAAGGCGGHRPNDVAMGRGRRPVINVSWEDAQAYVQWLSKKTGKRYRLLSEAEWEYAARAGTTTPFHFGSTISTSQANYIGSFAKGGYRGKTTPVGSFPANGFGLHDVHGNVFEWMEDCYKNYTGAPSDGSAWTSTNCRERVLRGGSWNATSGNIRSAFRFWDRSGFRNYAIGFRVARTLSP